MPINPVHAALLRNGKVLVVSGSGNVAGNTNFQAGIFDPQTGTFTAQSVSWDMFCNGMVVLPDGRAFVNGGTLQYDPFHGELRSAVYDLNAGTFSDVQNMAHGRWYPTVTNLGDGTLMTFSGLNENGDTNTTVEIYSASAGWGVPIPSPFTPPLYPRLHLLPNGKVFYSGSTTQSRLFDPAAKTWSSVVATTNYSGTRTYGSSVLLPLSSANNYKPVVMIMGGDNPATSTTELIDLSAPAPKWTNGPSMSQPRIEMNATILPNGKIIALGGSLNNEDTATASLNADLYDPVANSFSSAGSNSFARLYHSVALLLPDATVWLAGGNPARGTYEQHMEIYSPPYLFNPDNTFATRPVITGVPSSAVGYGAAFQVQTPDAASTSSVVLVRPGAPTHAFDMEQRLITLNFTIGSGVLNVTSPPTGNVAPPGYYMLFILNSSGVPSIAKFVQLTATPSDLPPTGTISSPATDVTITAGQTVYFSGSGSDPDGTIASYSWSLPGGSPAASLQATPGNVIYNSPGAFVATLTVTDNAGLADPQPPSRKITVNPAPDFGISAAPSSQTIVQAGGADYTLTLTPSNGFAGTVDFSVSGFPSGATSSFTPPSVSGQGTSTLHVATVSSTLVGRYTLTVTGSSAGLSHSATVTLTVNPASSKTTTTVALNSLPNPSVWAQAVTFTATITPQSGGGTVTGTVTFNDGASVVGTAGVSSNMATFSTSGLAVGSHSITAVYSGDANFLGSTSAALTQTVNKATSSTTLTSAPNPSIYGQSVTLAATISPQYGGTTTGTVTFNDGAGTIVSVAVSGNMATFTTAALATGNHSITAAYSGDTNFIGSTSSALAQTVNKATTNAVLTSALNPSTLGQTATFTATVTPQFSGVPTGTVLFKQGTATLGAGTLSGGVATFSISTLTLGSHIVTAMYGGDGNFLTSTSNSVTQKVQKVPTTTTVTSSLNPSLVGQTVTFTATVSSSAGAPPDGEMVTFKDGATPLGTVALSSGSAGFSTSSLAAGSHAISATYGGDATLGASSGLVTQKVNKIATTMALTSSPNPSTFGRMVTFTATVSSSAGAPPDGEMVTFKDGATVLGTVTLSGGTASFSTSSLAAGSHTISATYGGDATLGASSGSVTQKVNKVATTTTLSSSLNPSTFGQTVTFTATVSGSPPDGELVTFKNGSTTLGTGTLSGGSASLSTSALNAGSHSITASYGGDTTLASSSGSLAQVVNKAGTILQLTSSQNPSAVNQAVTFTAVVSSSGGTPGGTVTFKQGSTVLGTPTLDGNGQATVSTTFTSAGSYAITASYGGNANFKGSLASQTQVVQ